MLGDAPRFTAQTKLVAKRRLHPGVAATMKGALQADGRVILTSTIQGTAAQDTRPQQGKDTVLEGEEGAGTPDEPTILGAAACWASQPAHQCL